MAKKATKAVTKREAAPIANVIDFAADAKMGLEGLDKDSLAIPFLAILQGLSPQLETVAGAKPGLFCNTITNELAKEVEAIPCAYQRRYTRWAPRSEGGGFRGQFSPVEVETGKLEGAERNDEGRWEIDGDELKDTRLHFLLVRFNGGQWQPILLSLSSTQIKKSKRWLSRINGIELKTPAGKVYTPPSFSHIYTLRSVKEENNQGSWYGLEVDLKEPVTDAELYRKAKDFHKSVTAGEVIVAEPEATEDGF